MNSTVDQVVIDLGGVTNDVSGLTMLTDGHGSQIASLESSSSSQAQRIAALETSDDDKTSRIVSLESTTSDQATKLSSLGTWDGYKYSAINNLETTTSSNAAKISSLETRGDESDSRIATLESTDASHASRLTTVETNASDAQSRVGTLENTSSTHASRLTNVETKADTNSSKVTTLENTTATHASRLTNVETKAGANESRVTTLESTTATNASRIEEVNTNQGNAVASAIDTAKAYTDAETGVLKAERVIKADANGKVSGIHLLANGSGADAGGKMYFQADEIAIVPPNWNASTESDATQFPFYFSSDRKFMYLDEAVIKSLTADKIDSGRIVVDGLNLLSSDISMPAGTIQSHMIDPDFKDGLVRVNPDGEKLGGSVIESVTGITANGDITTAALKSGGNTQDLNVSITGPNIEELVSVSFDLQVLRNGAAMTLSNGSTVVRVSTKQEVYNTGPGGGERGRTSLSFSEALKLLNPTSGTSYTFALRISNYSRDDGHNYAPRIAVSFSASEPIVSSGGFITDVRWSEVKEQPSYVGLDTVGSSSYPRLILGNNPASSSVWLRVNSNSGGILPYSNGGSQLGTSSWKFAQVHSVNFYENGTALSSKYLGKSAKAADSSGLDGLRRDEVNAVVARYTTTGSGARLLIKLPFKTNSAKMLRFAISLYSGYTIDEYDVSGYLYASTNNWYAPKVIYRGTKTPDIKMGRTTDGYAYVSVFAGSYAGCSVHTVTVGYGGSAQVASNTGWSISSDSSTPNLVTPEVSKVWHSGNSGSGSGLDADLLDGLHASSFSRSNHSHSWGAITSKPSTFPPSTHGHDVSDVRGLVEGVKFSGRYPVLFHVGGNRLFSEDSITFEGSTNKLRVGNSVYFHDGYHPNADRWTSARTISLTGDATGSVSIDGSSNRSLPVTVKDDSHKHSQVYIPDTRGAARAPNYYPDRYVSFDFQQNTDTGAGDATWHVVQTVAKWSSYNSSHSQQQLAFTGNNLKHREATSDSSWGAWKKVWDTGNDSPLAKIGSTNTFTGDNYFKGILALRAANGAYQRADARDDGSLARTHKYGKSTTGGTSNFREAWFDGSNYINITAESGGRLSIDKSLTVGGDVSVGGKVQGDQLGITNTSNTSGKGISLYGGASSGQPTYGLMFAGTGTFGKHGKVTNDWATYLTMNSTSGRGWVFKAGTGSGGNVASINTAGYATFNRSYVGGASGFFFNDSGGRTAFTGGDLYIQTGVNTYYNYAKKQYHGNTSGCNHMFRGNALSGNGWNISTAGVVKAKATNGTVSRVLTYDDFLPSTPPAGLENTITANWIGAGAINARHLQVNSVVNNGGTYTSFKVTPDATRPLSLSKTDSSGKEVAPIFYVDTKGNGFFDGKLSKDTVDIDSIQEEARKQINPYYIGTVSGSTQTSTDVAMSSGGTHVLATVNVLGGKVNLSWEFSGTKQYFAQGGNQGYTAPTWRVEVFRGSSTSSTRIVNRTYTGSAYNDVEREIGFWDGQASIYINDQFSDITSASSQRYTIRVTRVSGTSTPIKLNRFVGSSPAFKRIEMKYEYTSLYYNAAGLGKGNITLSDDYDKYEFLAVAGAEDNDNVMGITLIPTYAIATETSKFDNNQFMLSSPGYGRYWRVQLSGKRTLYDRGENSIIRRIWGVNIVEKI